MTDELEVVDEQSWQEAAGLAGDPNFEKFETVQDLGKSYKEMQNLVSRSVRLPTEDASPEAREKFFEKLTSIDGVMRTPEGYRPPPEAPEGYEFERPENGMPPEVEGGLKAAAHKAGLTADQAAVMYEWMNTTVGAEAEEIKASNERGMEQLRGLWGQATEQRMQRAKAATQRLIEDNPELEDMVDKVHQIGHDATMIQVFDRVAEMLGEAGVTPATPRSMLTPEDASIQLAELIEHHGHLQEGDRGYDAFVQKRNNLYKAGGRLFKRGVVAGY